jgi:putative nucleotidyltransferase with HDIG domain
MPVMFLISLGFIIVILIGYTIYRVRQFKGGMRRPSTGFTVADLKKRDDAFLSARLQKTAADKAAVLESCPALREVHYMQVADELFPVSNIAVDDTIKKTLEHKVSALPPLPTTSLALLDLLQDPESNPAEITSLVSTNPVFSAKILQTVNSVYFNLPQRVTSVGRAITLLGYNNVRSLVFEDILYNTLPSMQDADREGYVNMWTHSAVVSACAGHLGKSLFRLSEYTIGTIGLLHDIGKYFYHFLEKREGAATGLPTVIEEEKQYGMNHAIIGAIIAHKWQLPGIITGAIEHHHSPSFFPPDRIPVTCLKESLVVCLSDLICKVLGYIGRERDLLPVREEYYKRYGLKNDLAEIVTPGLIKDIEKAHYTVRSYAGIRTPEKGSSQQNTRERKS